jgi:hypothetical protein
MLELLLGYRNVMMLIILWCCFCSFCLGVQVEQLRAKRRAKKARAELSQGHLETEWPSEPQSPHREH